MNGRKARHDYDAVIVGAGFAGIYMLYSLLKMGMTARVIEAGSGVGGTWYWNRYPGARCDVESLQYSYSFCDELQQQWVWTERYSSQQEILRYLRHVMQRFSLQKSVDFNTRVTSAQFDQQKSSWKITTDDNRVLTARFCIMATGGLSAATIPDIPGIDTFRGQRIHAGRWPKEDLDLSKQRVGVVGTGSTGVQLIPSIAKVAKSVTVFQRTPAFSVPARNESLSDTVQKLWKANYASLRAQARNTAGAALYEYGQLSALEVSESERTREYERRWANGGSNFMRAYRDLVTDMAANRTAAEYVKGKIRETIKDDALAKTLTSMSYPIGTKRICVDSGYYETFNRDNVRLADIGRDPIVGIKESSVVTENNEYDVDTLVFATGFDALTGALTRIRIVGRDDISLQEHWRERPRTFLGLMSSGFPNMFTITGPGSPSVFTNVVVSIEQHVEWIRDCIIDMDRRGQEFIEPSLEAEDQWASHVDELSARTLHSQTDSWYMGANIPGKPRTLLPYVGGFSNYDRICREVAEGGYRQLRNMGGSLSVLRHAPASEAV